jgi:alkylation response protein AidB-like acyl-CoA dehydrogenase
MDFDFTPEQIQAQASFRLWLNEHVVPFAEQNDALESTPPELIKAVANAGYLGSMIPVEYGGGGMEAITWGLLCEEFGRASASMLSLLIVHGMVAQVISRWGTEEQRLHWLPRLASGEVIGAFGLTEPNVGSDARSIESKAELQDDGTYLIHAEKKWISFGASATLFLIFAQASDKATAFLVERSADGFTSEPMKGMLGFRAANIARLSLKGVRAAATSIVGRPGFGFSHIASTALDLGRFAVAWGCTGLAQAALDASLDYAAKREQFGKSLNQHQLIQEMLANMMVDIKASRMLCLHAAFLKDRGEPSLIMETSIAKYFASRVAVSSANSAVQIHGANGCSSDYPVQRYFRDARIMEIIEGSTQIMQTLIARYGQQQHMVAQRSKSI